jgi:3-mercaptopyruvate sulfurtransferase SseA
VALDLAKLGVTRVRPLAGGFPEWQARGFPVERIATETAARVPQSHI